MTVLVAEKACTKCGESNCWNHNHLKRLLEAEHRQCSVSI